MKMTDTSEGQEEEIRDFITFFQAGEYEQCLTAAKKQAEVHPEDVCAFGYAGLSLLELERPGEAIPYLDRCIEYDAGQPQMWILRGECYLQIDQYEQAMHDFLLALALEPDKWGVYDKIGHCLYAADRKEEAIDWLKHSFREGHDPESGFMLLSMLEGVERTSEARRLGRDLAKQFPRDDRFQEFARGAKRKAGK